MFSHVMWVAALRLRDNYNDNGGQDNYDDSDGQGNNDER
jgi:hypothetical protein